MAKYTHRPVIIEAIQFNRNNIDELIKWTRGNLYNIVIPKCIDGIMTGRLKTLSDTISISEGDYIIKDANYLLERYHVSSSEEFKKTYEKVGD